MRIPLCCCCTVTLNISLPGFLGPYLYQELTRILLFLCKAHKNHSCTVSTINHRIQPHPLATERYLEGLPPSGSGGPDLVGDRRAASALACAHRRAAHDGAHGATSGLAAGRRWGFGGAFLGGKP